MKRREKKGVRNRKRRALRMGLVATGTLAAYAAFGSRPAYAYPAEISAAPGTAGGAGTGASLPVRHFDIPPGPLGTVLDAYRAAAQVTVDVTDPGLLQIPSPGVRGVVSVEIALRQILQGTTLTYRFTASDRVTITLEATSESVDVSADAPRIASPKFSEPLRDTPQSISVVSEETIQQQGTTTLRDALRNVAGISLAAGEGGAQGDNLTIRGFAARNDLFIDGMRDFGSYYRDSFNLEQVEVLKGPSSASFGRGSTGGVVNQASKMPHMTPSVAGTLSLGTDATYRGTADIQDNIPGIEGAAFRLNLMGNDSQVAGRDFAENQRFGVAPGLAFGLGTDTRVGLSYFHQTAKDIPDYGIPWYYDRPAPVDRSNYYGFPDDNHINTQADIGTARVEHEFNKTFLLSNQIRYAKYTRDVQVTEARIPTSVTPQTPLDQIQVTRNQITAQSDEGFLQDQLDLVTNVATGPIQHRIVTGFEAGRETSNPVRSTFTGVPTTSLLDPDPNQAFTGTRAVTSRVEAVADTLAAYVLDTMSIGQQWDVVAGFRWDRFDVDYEQSVAPAASFSRVDDMPSWRGAIVYKPKPTGSIYFNAGTSFNPSAEALALSAATVNTDPEENRTFELGSKWDFADGRFSARLALYRTEKTNAREPDPNNPLLNVNSGSQRVDGIEIEGSGRVTRDWQLVVSYSHLNGELTRSEAFPNSVGARLANVPSDTFSLWSVVTLPWKLQVGGGARYVGSRTASTTVPLDPTTGLLKELPGYWVFDAMLSYPFTQQLSLQVNIYNIANEYYFDQIHPGHIVPGPGRSALFGLGVKL